MATYNHHTSVARDPQIFADPPQDDDYEYNQGSFANVGGPPLQNYNIQPRDVNDEANNELFQRVQAAAATGVCNGNDGPLCRAINTANMEPVQCMMDLLANYSRCGTPIPEDKRKKAYEAFVASTGYQPADLSAVSGQLDQNLTDLVAFNGFYMFAPAALLIIILIWIMVGFRRMAWELGLFLTVFVVVVMYTFSIAYRTHFNSFIAGRNSRVQTQLNSAQKNFQDSLAYWPEGMFAAACAVTCDNNNCWGCHNNRNPNITVSPTNYPDDEDEYQEYLRERARRYR